MNVGKVGGGGGSLVRDYDGSKSLDDACVAAFILIGSITVITSDKEVMREPMCVCLYVCLFVCL